MKTATHLRFMICLSNAVFISLCCLIYTDTSEEVKGKIKLLVAEVKADPNAYIEEIFVDKAAGVARRTVWLKGEKKREGELSFGKEHEHTTLDGRVVKVSLSITRSVPSRTLDNRFDDVAQCG